ncbi:MAG: flagellar motor switch protein FliN [Armatimonadetes bacterium]|nr:flagellar motor switch protein FliN [Armatimonadota bacterium]
MAHIPIEVTDKLSSIQQQIWQTVSLKVSEASDNVVGFISPLTLSTAVSDIFSELATPHLVIQFSLADSPEHPSVLLLDADTYASLASYLKGEKIYDVDDNLIADIRPALEAMVQGICLAIGSIKNEPVVATGLAIRYQIFNAPQNMQKATELVRTNVALSADELSGTVVWLVDAETAHSLVGIPYVDEDAEADYEAIGSASSLRGGAKSGPEDTNSLELLMDIPLEISVELGRIKMMVKDVVDLGTGSIIEIDKAAGEPVDVLVNGRLVARGEVVVIEDNFGVRITEILTPQERLQRLNEAA